MAYTAGGKTLSVIAKSTGEVAVVDNGQAVASFTSHAGAATGLALHPCGDLLVSVGVDKSFVYYDLAKMTVISQVYTDSGMLFKVQHQMCKHANHVSRSHMLSIPP